MFHPITSENWDRQEIFTAFEGYLYCMTVELDVTEFLQTLHKKGRKFYPSICYCIAKTVNANRNFRFARVNNAIGYWDQVHAHYTVLRKNTDHLFKPFIRKIFLIFIPVFWRIKKKLRTATACILTRAIPWTTSIFPSCQIPALPDSAIPSRILLQNMELPIPVSFLLS